VAEGLTVQMREGLALATVMARKGVSAQAIGEALSATAPEGPRIGVGEGLSLIGTGPGTWLALAEAGDADFEAGLRARLGPLASVSDQSSGYVVFRLAGPAARTLLQRGAPIDLHPAAFPAGGAAVTVIAHVGVILWLADEAPSFDVAVFRSFAGSFRHWLDAAAQAL
jgi:sarcosine oxidase subunit gamma